MRLLFCSDPLDVRRTDSAYEVEAAAARELGIDISLINFEALVYDEDAGKAIQRVAPPDHPCMGVFRGWMLTPHRYRHLYEALAERGIELINSPDAYQHCHYLPESYAVIEQHTPRSVWLSASGDVSTDSLMELLRPFGSQPVIVKDFVKSRKHEWNEACFIPSASNREAVERVVGRFMELQGDDLNGGLVFREFIEFEQLTAHSRSGIPLAKEYRLFILDGEPISTTAYWEEGSYDDAAPSNDDFRTVMKSVRSRFFTMDVAQRRSGEWIIVELGDGQVAGLPERADPTAFYQALKEHVMGREAA